MGEIAVPTLRAGGSRKRDVHHEMARWAPSCCWSSPSLFHLGLLAYAMYVLLGVMLVSRFLTRNWAESLVGDARVQPAVGQGRRQRGGGDHAQEHGHAAGRLGAARGPAAARRADVRAAAAEDQRPARAAHDVPRPRPQDDALSTHADRRGYYQIGPLVLETGDLFGLHRRYRVATEPHFLLVCPQVLPLAGYDIASRRPIGEVRMTYRLFEDPTRIAGVRGYEPGDPLNRVHWRATARTGMLHSKVYEPSTVAGATLLLDFHTAAHDASTSRIAPSWPSPRPRRWPTPCICESAGRPGDQRPRRRRPHPAGRLGPRHRSRADALASASMRDKSDRLAAAGRADPPRAGAACADSGDAGPRRIDRWPAAAGADRGNRQPHAARRDGDRHFAARLDRIGHGPGQSCAAAALRSRCSSTCTKSGISPMAAAPFLAEGIDTRHLKDEESIMEICRSFALR